MQHEDLKERRILVTGGSRGIGREVCRHLAAAGSQLIVVARSQADVDSCLVELPGEGHRGLAFDVGDASAWSGAQAGGALDDVGGVVTAAAVLAPVGPIGSYSAEEFWQTMRINVLGTLLAIQSCLASLERERGAVVTFAGGGATSPQPRYDAYATSKAAVVRLTENLALELRERGVRANCVSPGFVATDIHRATLEAGPERAGAGYYAKTEQQLDDGGAPAAPAIALTAFLLSAAAQGITGRLISAQWDPWSEPDFQRRLREEPDLATIRRIDDQFFAAVAAAEAK